MHQHHTIDPLSCPRCDREPDIESGSVWADRRIGLIASSAILFSIGLIIRFVFSQTLIATILFVATAILTGYHIAWEGLETLVFQRRLSIDFLIT
ncbi:MAG: hypothetical protein NWE83_05535, partial [Candidatus Bathyarchaeota archaeon]|nr:hypothetical protein [Candidatus Bathyarchaeota archaeon]